MKPKEPLEDWYLKSLLDDCNYAIGAEEDFADGGPPIEHWRDILIELRKWRAGKMKANSKVKSGKK